MRIYSVGFRLSWGLICLFLLVLTGVGVTFAQGNPTPIAIGENAIGVLSAESPGARYVVTAAGGETVALQVLSLSGGLIPRFQVYNPDGTAILDQGNVSGALTLTNTVSFTAPGAYIIAIQGENGTTGQFVLSLQAGTPLPAVELTRSQPVSDIVGSSAPLRVYSFSTTTADANLTLSVLSQTSGAGVLVSLVNEDAGKTLAASDSSLGGVAYRLLAADRRYRVEVRAGSSSGDTAFSICVGTCVDGPISPNNTQPAAPVSAPTATSPSIPQAAVCTVSSTSGGAANIRSGPGTVYLITGSLPAGTAASVIGQNSAGGNAWFEINLNGQVGWVSASVTRHNGDCSAVPFASAPANAPLAPTVVPTQPPQPPQQPEEPSGNDNGNNDQPPSDALPDLEVTVTQLNRPNGDDTVAIGFNILNRGDASAPSASIQICIDGSCNNAGFTRTLAPGETDTSFVTFNLPPKPLVNGVAQYYNITIKADADNQLNEIAKSNNTYLTQIS